MNTSKELRPRRHPRYELADESGLLELRLRSELMNISLGGVGLRTSAWLDPGRHYRVRLGKGLESTELDASAVWCQAATDGLEKRFVGGLQFSSSPTDRAEPLLQFIYAHPILDVQREVYGRFTIDYVDPVLLETRYDFLAKSISLGGMRLETQAPLRIESEVGLTLYLDGREFTTAGRIRHVTEAPRVAGRSAIQAGIEFVDSSPDSLELLRSFIYRQSDSTH